MAGSPPAASAAYQGIGILGSDLDDYVAQLIRCERINETGIRMICDKVGDILCMWNAGGGDF